MNPLNVRFVEPGDSLLKRAYAQSDLVYIGGIPPKQQYIARVPLRQVRHALTPIGCEERPPPWGDGLRRQRAVDDTLRRT